MLPCISKKFKGRKPVVKIYTKRLNVESYEEGKDLQRNLGKLGITSSLVYIRR